MLFLRVQHTTKINQQMPMRYLWPMTIIVSLVIALWLQFPFQFTLYPIPSAPSHQRMLTKVAYIKIDAASVNQLVKQAASEWMLGSGSNPKRRPAGLDLTALETSLEAPPPLYLEKGSILPSEWQVGEIVRPSVDIPPILAAKKDETTVRKTAAPRVSMVNTRLSASLQLAKFQVQISKDVLKALSSTSGHCQFFVECNNTGEIEHLVRLSPPTQDSFVLERLLARGKAATKVSGCVDIDWVVYK